MTESGKGQAEDDDEFVVRFTERARGGKRLPEMNEENLTSFQLAHRFRLQARRSSTVGSRFVFAPEYGVTTPLWPNGVAVDRIVPPEPLERLIRWQALFDATFTGNRVGCRIPAKEQYAADAIEMQQQFRNALNGKVDLIVDLWPLN
ncbi:MAG: hypothetical protein ACLPSM_04395 [Acidimicrobiales bacterium]